MSENKKGAKVKGYLKRIDNGKIFKFQFNPTTIDTNRNANYNEIKGCGSPYPVYQYTGGEGEDISFILEIFNDYSKCKEAINYLEGLMPSKNPKDKFKVPPIFYFSFGASFTEKCILTSFKKTHQQFDKDLRTTDLTINIELKVIK